MTTPTDTVKSIETKPKWALVEWRDWDPIEKKFVPDVKSLLACEVLPRTYRFRWPRGSKQSIPRFARRTGQLLDWSRYGKRIRVHMDGSRIAVVRIVDHDHPDCAGVEVEPYEGLGGPA